LRFRLFGAGRKCSDSVGADEFCSVAKARRWEARDEVEHRFADTADARYRQ
jgi:hypothetical protein